MVQIYKYKEVIHLYLIFIFKNNYELLETIYNKYTWCANGQLTTQGHKIQKRYYAN